ncbi:MAG: hypothetical protein ACODAU_02030 [Myxococcota bacterium]
MDPSQFQLDWERTAEALTVVIVMSFFVERALALVFEHRAFVLKLKGKGYKEPIAFAVAFAVCQVWDFDAVSMVIVAERTPLLGKIITAGVIAGGSKASIKLFHDVMDVKSSAQRAQSSARTKGVQPPAGAANPPQDGGA